jgi:hypothetical protein
MYLLITGERNQDEASGQLRETKGPEISIRT